jgi:hypothetical protein
MCLLDLRGLAGLASLTVSKKRSQEFKYFPIDSPISSTSTRTPLRPKENNIQLSQKVSSYIRKPDQRIQWGCIPKWQKKQPNDYTSKSSFFFILFIILINI